jgi:cellulose biosynthesis protein BcsQ
VAENIFTASDYLLAPLIPTTFSVHSYERLLSFLASEGRFTKQVFAFFSMVDARRKLQRQIMAMMRAQYSGILRSSIPNLSQIEQMGVYREPVPAFAPSSNAADCYQSLWTEIREEVLDE